MFGFLTSIIGEALIWLKYLLYFLIFDTLFRTVAGPFLIGLKSFVIYVLNLGYFRLFPEAAIVYIANCFIFMITVEILFLVLGRYHQPNPHGHHQESNDSKAH